VRREYSVCLLVIISVAALSYTVVNVHAIPSEPDIRSILNIEDGDYASDEGGSGGYVEGIKEFLPPPDCKYLGAVIVIDEEATWRLGAHLLGYPYGVDEAAMAMVRKASKETFQSHEVVFVPSRVFFWDSPDDCDSFSTRFVYGARDCAGYGANSTHPGKFLGYIIKPGTLDYLIPIWEDVLIIITGQTVDKYDPKIQGWGAGKNYCVTYPEAPSFVAVIKPQWFGADWRLLAHELLHVLGGRHHYDARWCVMDYTWRDLGLHQTCYKTSTICSDCLTMMNTHLGEEHTHIDPGDPTKIW